MAVASTVDARSKVSAPEVVICPEGVTVNVVAAVAGSRVIFLEQFFFTGVAGISFSFFRLLYGTKSRIGPLSVMSSQQAAQVHEAA